MWSTRRHIKAAAPYHVPLYTISCLIISWHDTVEQKCMTMLRAARVMATSYHHSYVIICNQRERRKLCLNWHNSSAMQGCRNWIQKYTMITLFMASVSIMPLLNLAKISLPDRSMLIPQNLICSYCFGTPRKRDFYPFIATSPCHLLP